jgi:hypothetical protein
MQQVNVTGVQKDTVAAAVPPDYAAARRWLWRVFVVIVVGAWAGTTWDQVWHATVPFDGFWSPPHIVVYVTVAFVAFVVMGMLFHSPIRRAFGRGFDVKVLPFKVPGALFVLGIGIVLLGFAGAVLDNLWHTAFGLNETGWSFPHAMIGWSLNLVAFGIVACRLSMLHVKPLPWTTTLLIGGLTGSMLLGSLLGPIGSNRTPATVDFFFTYIPALASQESAQNVYRIYETWNLNRTNPALLLLAPFALGVILGWVRKLDGRWWMTLLIISMVLLMDAGDQDLWNVIAQFIPEYAQEPNWRALPVVLPTMLLLLLVRFRVNEHWAYGLAGILFALMIFDIWDGESAAWLLALLAPLFILFGKGIGERLHHILMQPWTLQTVAPLVASVVVIPAITGLVDLVLRWMTV